MTKSKPQPFGLKGAKSEGFIKDSKKKTLYGNMWFDEKIESSFDTVRIRQSGSAEKPSRNSYRFCGVDGNDFEESIDVTCELLKTIFISDNERKALFEKKFKQACGGSGNEYLKITTMHSSSLCALLFFYGVSCDKPLTLEWDTKNYVFTESVFEYKSPVFESGSPSNMDVVLLGHRKGEEGENEKVALFLESKFSEYIDNQGKYGKSNGKGINKEYLIKEPSKELYSEESLKKLGLIKVDMNDEPVPDDVPNLEDGFVLCVKCENGQNKKDAMFYIHGIKQMISHYVGVKNVLSYIKDDSSRSKLISDKNAKIEEPGSQTIVNDYLDNETKIILGEILFDFPEFKDEKNKDVEVFKKAKNRYSKKYGILAGIINDLNKGEPDFEMLDAPLYYSLFKTNGFELDQKVKEYYGIK